ncbi:nuclear transport factor 2-like isoform X2 [Impatiens glandulifera]|uniref:nuclear transport factor 2-like isoform X2 n=1 Tax=Impatiens glandulifera TaxID=253017 RepID=UPI001FB06FA1|nr:nuclear transport factor 2-like isoform X2 [Impatiens glandulifera]
MATSVQPPVPQVVGNAFVQQYYHILHQSPSLVHQFYQDISQLGRPSVDGSMTITTTMEAIDAKILSQNYSELTPEIKTVDAQESCNGGVHVLVTGCLVGKDNVIQNFTQTFFLATQEKGYFVLNDMLRYTGDANNSTEITVSSNNVVDRSASAPQQVESEQIVVPVNVETSVDAADNGEVVVVKEEVPVAKVVVEVPNEPLKKVVSDSKVQEPKKSYASIVMVMKGNGPAISSPTPAPRKIAPKIQEQQANLVQASVSAAEIPLSGPGAAEDANNQETEADGYSIYIKGLPLTANPGLLEEEFKKFGTIKSGGIQVRSKQGFCFGFVEFEAASAVEKAIEASPITIGGRQVFVQEKMSNNNSHVNNRGGRFQGGRMSGFRNEGPRGGGGGRGNYGRGGGYNNSRGDFNGRNDFGNNNNRGGNWGGFPNRGAGGGGNNGSRVNHSGGFNGGGGGGGEAKATTAMPHVSATA